MVEAGICKGFWGAGGHFNLARLLTGVFGLGRGAVSFPDMPMNISDGARQHPTSLRKHNTFTTYVGDCATGTLRGAVLIAQEALAGHLNRPNGNGGRTVGDEYLPPEPDGGVKRHG